MNDILDLYAAITLLNGFINLLQSKKNKGRDGYMPGEKIVLDKLKDVINELQEEVSTEIVKDFLDASRAMQEQQFGEEDDE